LLVTALLSTGVYALTRAEPRREIQAGLTALNRPTGTDFARVSGPKELSFPADHGPHPDYGIEWWYFSGNLDSDEGSHFGYELALFRIGLSRQQPDRRSRWGASQLYMGHLAVTDVSKNRFHSFERISRGALGLAGSSLGEGQTFRVWLEDWSILGEGSEKPTVRLTAGQDDVAIGLELVSARPLVLQGDRGFSQKSASPDNASYYYSNTRIATSGILRVDGQSFAVSGDSWMDHEWSTSALGEDQVGWDWFSLQLSDGRDLMFYQLRNNDGGIDPFSSGTVVRGDGTSRRLSAEDVNIQVLDTWESPHGGKYPIKWRMSLPSEGIEVQIIPYVKNQELDVSIRYWEGAVELTGTSKGRPIAGKGYVEMTGYADTSGGRS
jgi:predicted secreted hydrolase